MTVDLPAGLAAEWRPSGTQTKRQSIALATIVAETTLYEHIQTAEALSLEESEIPVRSLFAINLTFEPPLSSLGVTPKTVFSMAAPQAKRQFVKSVEDDGLVVEGERKAVPFEHDDGSRGRWYVLEVAYPVDPALTPDGSGTIEAETHIVVWPTDTTYGMAGGTVPLEAPGAFAGSLEIHPERDRETIVQLVRSVEFPNAETVDDASSDTSRERDR